MCYLINQSTIPYTYYLLCTAAPTVKSTADIYPSSALETYATPPKINGLKPDFA